VKQEVHTILQSFRELHSNSHNYVREIRSYGTVQWFPNFLGCGPPLLLNIFRGAPGGLDNTKDI